MNTDNAIRVENLRKEFGETQAVRDISFHVAQGEILTLLGPNGAGKSTTLSMLSCLLLPSGGDAWVMGHSIRSDPMGVKAAIGVVPQEIAVYLDLSARENLCFWAKMYGIRGSAMSRRVDEVLEIIGLTDRQKEASAKFSGGMKRRLNIGLALLHRPQVIIMDEPTVGIDPQSRRNILDSIKALNQQGMTVLYTTHYMEEAQELAHRIAIVDKGQLIACGTHTELVKIVGELDRVELTLNAPLDPAVAGSRNVLDGWRGLEGVRQVAAQDGQVRLLVESADRILPRLFDAAVGAGVRVTSVNVQEPNLEAVFLHLTGRALRD